MILFTKEKVHSPFNRFQPEDDRQMEARMDRSTDGRMYSVAERDVWSHLKLIVFKDLSQSVLRNYVGFFNPGGCSRSLLKHCLATLKYCSKLAKQCLSNTREHPPGWRSLFKLHKQD